MTDTLVSAKSPAPAPAGLPRNAPRITIVTASYNQGRFIGRTIDSVLAQDYPNLEHIVVDGMSTDETVEVLARYPHLTVIREPDKGQADAINKGLNRATGDILAFLNADDTLLPGALHRVAAEIDPARGRHIVMGRCRFIDEDDRFLGIEHPSDYRSHARMLAIWQGYTVPQPALFWTREVWQRCGPMNADEHLVLDYDLFCRFSARYRFHPIDQVFATYRLHAAAKTAQADDAQRLEQSIRVSRRYWGPPTAPLYWRLAASLALHRLDRIGRARTLMREAQAARQAGRLPRAVGYGLAGAVLAPRVAFYLAAYPPLRARANGVAQKLLGMLARRRGLSAATKAYLESRKVWDDGWAGPHVILPAPAGIAPGTPVVLKGAVDLSLVPGSQTLIVKFGGDSPRTVLIERTGPFEIAIPSLPAEGLEVIASDFYVPHLFRANNDHRPLSWRFDAIAPADTATP